MAVKPYREGDTWSFRLRIKGQDIYQTGFDSEAKARRECERLRQKLLDSGAPKHGGPWKNTLALALQIYGMERLPFLKGAPQEANRINRFLRAAGLDVLTVTELANGVGGKGVYYEVTLVSGDIPRKIPNSLKAHRQRQSEGAERTDRVIRQLAKTPVAEIRSYQMQALVDAMQCDEYGAATIGLQRALLRRLFNYSRKIWQWVAPANNPASDLVMPKIDNARSRVLTNAEWARLSPELAKSGNKYAAPAIALLLETAMRISEPILHAKWDAVDWNSSLIHLEDSKSGPRSVPLSVAATEILRALHALRDDQGCDPRILPVTYESLKAAWNRACEAAGIEGVHIHDLRHTAATRFTLQLNGNLPVLKVITGHKTYSQLNRYINVKPEDVSRLLQGRPLTEDAAPAGLHIKRAELLPPSLPTWRSDELPKNVIPLRRAGQEVQGVS